MGLFNKFKKQPTTVNRNFNIEALGIDTSSWFEVFSACLGKMVIIQEACSDLIVKNRDWNVDFSKGTISFGKDEYPLQFLGSESTNSNSWMWGWNNIMNRRMNSRVSVPSKQVDYQIYISLCREIL